MFTSLGSLLSTLPKRSRVPEAIVALHVRRAFGEALAKTCGDIYPAVLAQVKAKSFKDGVLTVEGSSLVCAELTMRSGDVARILNEMLGRKAVKAIRFKSV